MRIPHSRPTIGREEAAAAAQVIASGKIAQAGVVEQFEQALAGFVRCRGAVAVSSGTAALHVTLLGLGIGPTDQVAVPSYVCSAVLHAVRYVGAEPLLVDVDPTTFNVDPSHLRKVLTPRTRAVIVPHMFGLPADLAELLELGLPVIEDCAHALGATYHDRPVGGWGDVAVFSFYATKMITTGEGGMIATNSAELLDRMRDLREYDNKEDDVLRFNYKMTDISAAVGIAQLRRLAIFLAQRRALAQRYTEAFAEFGLRCPVTPEMRTHAFYRYVGRFPAGTDDFLLRMGTRGVQCKRPVFAPLHRMLGKQGYPGTEAAHREAISIPLYPSLTEVESEQVMRMVVAELATS